MQQKRARYAVLVFALLFFTLNLFAQETTGGLQGTLTDQSGAVVPGADVNLIGSTLVGTKTLKTDAKGYYHFANLPPGNYNLTATAQGFKSVKRDDITIEIGHLPTLNLTLEVGTSNTVVEVSGEAPVIDVTTEHTLTNITQDVVQNVPHGYSFQSVIQFAPGARNEPLAGGRVGPNAAGGTGTGGDPPGSGTNGQGFGYSIGGGADSENAYLVEGQETADAIGGFSHSNVPFAFIQEVQVKSSGVEAEYGGALGGVVNVVMQKGGNAYHGSVFSQFETGEWDGSPDAYPRYDPTFAGGIAQGNGLVDATYQNYQPKRDTLTDIFPGFTFGGPIIKNKLWFFTSFNPEFRDRERIVNWNWAGNAAFPAQVGTTPFSSNSRIYYTNARIDAALTQKIRVFGSWLYQFQRVNGEFLPAADSVNGLTNPTATSPPQVYGHNLGFAAPNVTTNAGLDYTISPHLVGTFRWGYNFQNYHDFGAPTGGVVDSFVTSGLGACDNTGGAPSAACPGGGTPIPSSPLSQIAGFFSVPNNINNTTYNVTHRNQIDADVAWYKSGWAGTHNFKFGYQLMRLSNAILQHWNEPDIQFIPGRGNFIADQGGATWAQNCALADPGGSFDANTGTTINPGLYGGCAGKYGYMYLYDIGSNGNATSMNHAFFVQDAWTIGHGLTINAGVRLEHEFLPAENQPTGGIGQPIKFGWADKVAPRLGAAWDPLKNGKWKIFGSYGQFYDIMKLNLAISSFGGQYWNNCYYALNTTDISSITAAFDSNTRYCGGPGAGVTTPGVFAGGVTPPGITFIQDTNQRTFPTTCATCTNTEEGVAPGLNPYKQHELVLGVDHQLANNLAFEARWDRRRLDNAIEDAALFNANLGSETFVIVNPGKGVDKTFDGFYNFLYGTPSNCQTLTGGCPPALPTAVRNYDGVELRLTKTTSNHWAGMFSYTYSRFWGNYTGLTNTDVSDGGGGRNAPNNSRAFDEPYFYYDAAGKLNNGLLPTDRPNAFKGYAYYELPWWHNKFTTNLGLFQYLYQGSPVSTYVDEGISVAPFPATYGVPSAEGGAFPTYVLPRGQFLPLTENPDGSVSVGTPYVRRTPWFTQTDLQLQQNFKLTESKSLNFSVIVPNALNQRSVTAYWTSADSNFYPQWLAPPSADCGGPCSLPNGPAFYKAAMSGYNLQSLFNNAVGATGPNGAMTISSIYNKPLYRQLSRNMYMTVKFSF